mmetsp:Transcript_6299/g.21677  ORF Transcript_6299/g.21677 Transcript_6299/m.21677 type:complete len:403 (-) Transcript_6299:21-1229(-)
MKCFTPHGPPPLHLRPHEARPDLLEHRPLVLHHLGGDGLEDLIDAAHIIDRHVHGELVPVEDCLPRLAHVVHDDYRDAPRHDPIDERRAPSIPRERPAEHRGGHVLSVQSPAAPRVDVDSRLVRVFFQPLLGEPLASPHAVRALRPPAFDVHRLVRPPPHFAAEVEELVSGTLGLALNEGYVEDAIEHLPWGEVDVLAGIEARLGPHDLPGPQLEGEVEVAVVMVVASHDVVARDVPHVARVGRGAVGRVLRPPPVGEEDGVLDRRRGRAPPLVPGPQPDVVAPRMAVPEGVGLLNILLGGLVQEHRLHHPRPVGDMALLISSAEVVARARNGHVEEVRLVRVGGAVVAGEEHLWEEEVDAVVPRDDLRIIAPLPLSVRAGKLAAALPHVAIELRWHLEDVG